jgi:hypothetical protein
MNGVIEKKWAGITEHKAGRTAVNLSASYMMYNDWCDCEIIDVCGWGAAFKSKQVFMKNDLLSLRIGFEERSAVISTTVTFHAGMKTGIVFTEQNESALSEFLGIVDAVLARNSHHQAREFFRKAAGRTRLPAELRSYRAVAGA